LKGLIKTFSIIQDSVRVHCDSQSAIHLVKDHRCHKRTKHIDVRYHKIRQWVVDDEVIDLVKINTKKNPADIVTPRSQGYGDVMATYIREVKTRSRVR